MERLIAFDQDLLIYLNNLGNETWDPFWLFITNIKHSLPMFFVLFVIIGFKMKTKKVFTVIIGTLLLLGIILLVTELTKAGFQRERPMVDELLEGKIRELIATQNYSFFSGHTAVSFGLSTFLITTLRKQIKWIWILLLWAAFFSYSRIYVGAHYPFDIIVGMIVGIFLSFSFSKMINKLLLKNKGEALKSL